MVGVINKSAHGFQIFTCALRAQNAPLCKILNMPLQGSAGGGGIVFKLGGYCLWEGLRGTYP